DIKNFAQEKRLDALLTDENWKKIGDSEIYKNYKTKFQRRIVREIEKIDFLQDATYIYANISAFQDLCLNVTGSADLQLCSENISTPLQNRKRRQVVIDDFEEFEASGDNSGIDDDDDDLTTKDEEEEPLGCDSIALNKHPICADLEAAKKQSANLQLNDTSILKTLEESYEDYQANLGRWCPPMEKKSNDLTMDGSDQQIIQECQEDENTVYKQYDEFLWELEAEVERENEEELKPRNPRETKKTKEEEIIEAIEAIQVASPPDENELAQIVEKAENIVDEYAERVLKNLPQHARPAQSPQFEEFFNCPPNLNLTTWYSDKESYKCPLIHFDDEIKVKIESQKTVGETISNELEEIDELLDEIKSFSSMAEEILKSMSKSGLPAKIVGPEDNVVSKKMDLPEAVLESFEDSAIGLDVHFSMQTVPHYANLFYLGDEEDFEKDPTRRRKRRKRENTLKGDAIFVSIEGNGDLVDECAKDSSEWMLKVDIFTKEGKHVNLTATIPDKQDGGRFVNVRLLQRLNRFELLVRSTNLAEYSEMTTENLVQCTDDESCLRDFEFFELAEQPRILFKNQKPKLIMRPKRRPKRLRTKAKKVDDCLELENCKEKLWCLLDQLPDSTERMDYIEESKLREEIGYLSTPSNLGGQEVGYVGLKINQIEALEPAYEPKVDTTFNFIVNNKFIVPEELEQFSKTECTRFDADGEIVLNSIELGNKLCLEDKICESEDSAAVVVVSEMFDVDVSKEFDIFTFASGTISVSNGEIVLKNKNGESVAKPLKNIENCRGMHCDIKIGIALGGINQGKKGSFKAYGRIFVNDEGTNLVGSFFESLPLTQDSSQFWSETAGINELKFYGPEGHVVKHMLVASDKFNFREEINKMIDGECENCQTFDVTLLSSLNILSSVKNVASTCEQIPTLDLHLDKSSVFYELEHKDETSWSEVFKPELDRHGLMGHTYLSTTLYNLKSRALGIRAKFTVHECDPLPRYQNIIQYVVKFYDENKEFDKTGQKLFRQMLKILIEDCKKIIVKLHCHTHELALNLGVENDLVIYYNKEGNVADDVYEYDEAKIFTPAGQEVSFSGTCPKETRSRKKCAQKRLQLGSDNNSVSFSKFELFKPAEGYFKNTVNMLGFTNLQTCPTEFKENQLYYCSFP
ncbi:unnamed protein product, partial [Oikopleura dioica]